MAPRFIEMRRKPARQTFNSLRVLLWGDGTSPTPPQTSTGFSLPTWFYCNARETKPCLCHRRRSFNSLRVLLQLQGPRLCYPLQALSILLESYCNTNSMVALRSIMPAFNSLRVLLQRKLPRQTLSHKSTFNSLRVLLQPKPKHLTPTSPLSFNSLRVLLQLS